jgi:hypothetical protein
LPALEPATDELRDKEAPAFAGAPFTSASLLIRRYGLSVSVNAGVVVSH